MLSLKQIVKNYLSGDNTVTALRGVDIDFRENEFVAILGPSGCGKTTLLNVIGGLDRYTSGDLVINGRSTKEYNDADWDTYRNHSIGFVFQSYNLITHQNVLSNVELALTLSGVPREERRARAVAALEQVGLGDQLSKRPNQMSGGQMQRVAIARALVNDPDILLADEPTGALDTATSVQIMDILKEVAKKKLVIMVTHNPELAEQYATRIIRVRDGLVVDDSDPYTAPAEGAATEASADETGDAASIKEAAPAVQKPKKKKKKRAKDDGTGKGKKSMSRRTALSLSFNNLMTKKGRTLLVSVAGSIGIIGIAMILALSNGVNLFIASIQEETLTSYPISITSQTSDYSAMMAAMVGTSGESVEGRDPNKVYVDDSISNMVSAMTTMKKNNLADFNKYLMERYDTVQNDLTAIQYSYNMDLQIFNASTEYGKNGVLQVSPSGILKDFSTENAGLSGITDSISIFSQIMPGKMNADGNKDLINAAVKEQYDVVDGRWPENETELVLVVDRNNTISNITLYMLGMLNPDELTAMMASMMIGEKYDANTQGMEFSYQDFYDLDLKLAYNSDFYAQKGTTDNDFYYVNGQKLPKWQDLREQENFLPENVYDKGLTLKIVGVVAPNGETGAASISGSVAYTSALVDAVLAKVNESAIVKQQVEYKTHDVLTGLPFKIDDVDTLDNGQKKEKLKTYFESLTDGEKATVYMNIRTFIPDAKMAEYLTAVKQEMNTTEKQREFLINLYAFNSKNGSLEEDTFANEAVAIILHAVNNKISKETYKTLIAKEYGAAFGLDGKVVSAEGEGKEAYAKYAGLIDTLYNTPEKMTKAFDNMTAMTIRSVYPMVESMNLQQELLQPTAPHFVAYLTQMNTQCGTEELKTMYLVGMFCMTNGLYDPTTYQLNMADPLAQAYLSYLSTVDVAAEFNAAVVKEYQSKITSDEAFRTAATAALFDAYCAALTDEEWGALYADHMEKSSSEYEKNLELLGASVGYDALTAINIYPVDFEAKERLAQLIKDYNAGKEEDDQISYTDIMAIIMGSVTVIINAISYVLIAFVSISLVVSSIMIGIITYISVLERTKEIGILRAIGASKKDISRVFNAETVVIGFAAGLIGVLFTVVMCIPISAIIRHVSGIQDITAALPFAAAVILVAISMILTMIAGLIPSRIASKKDPVEALRTE